jgi:hypothetical protein
MPTPNYKVLIESFDRFPDKAPRLLRESLAAKDLNPHDFDFGRLFEQCFGWEEFRSCRQSGRLAHEVFEAAGAVSTSAFKDISGQIIYAMTLEAMNREEFVFSKLIPEYQSPFTFEKVAGLTDIGPGNDDEWIVEEGEEFQTVGVGQDWINLPETKKRGKIVPLTREAVFFDRTNTVQTKCGEVGYWLQYNDEIRAIDCVVDENAGAKSAALGGHRYHWQDTSYATYADSSAGHPWDNLVASNALVDWTDIDGADQVLNEITDPFTGTPVVIERPYLVCTKQLEKTAGRIKDSTKLQVVTPGYATSGNPTLTEVGNPYAGAFEVLSSRLLAQRMATDTTWYYGDLKGAFIKVVNFPFQTKQAPPNSDDEFKRDIVAQWRADMRNAYGTKQPRKMAKCTVA